jgi:hypothetical protein
MIEEAAETGYPPAMIRIAWAKLLGTHTRLLHFLSQIKTVMKFFCIKKQCCGSEMFILDPGSKVFHHGSQILHQKDPGSGLASKNLSIFKPKTVSQLPEIGFGMFIPDPNFSHTGSQIWIPDPGVKKPKKKLIPDPYPQHC